MCPYGYELAPDGRHCQDIDECSTEANNCRYDCKNLIGSFVCVCPEGFKKVPGSQDECTDIDECLGDGRTLCGPGGTCFNSPGGYSCLCGQVYVFVRPTELLVKVLTSRAFRVTKRLRMEKSAWTGGKEPATIVLLVVSVVKHLQ